MGLDNLRFERQSGVLPTGILATAFIEHSYAENMQYLGR